MWLQFNQVPTAVRVHYATDAGNVENLRRQVQKWKGKVVDQQQVMQWVAELVAQLISATNAATRGRPLRDRERRDEDAVVRTAMKELLAKEPAIASYYSDYRGAYF